MARQDPDFMRVQIGFLLNDPRFLSLTMTQRMVYLYLWGMCVRERTETLPSTYTAQLLPRLITARAQDVVSTLKACAELGLCEVREDGRITVYGVRGCHSRLPGWKDANGDPYGSDRGQIGVIRREEKRREEKNPPLPPADGGDEEEVESEEEKAAKKKIERNAHKLLDYYSDRIKSRSSDNSGSKKIFTKTVTDILNTGVEAKDLAGCIDNYARECEEHGQEESFRKGFQGFFGPRMELWKDYQNGWTLDRAERPEDRDYRISEADEKEIYEMNRKIAEEENDSET